jgi:hypothetical protein
VVGVDSSGIVRNPPEPVWMAAIRKVNVQHHNILFLSVPECQRYRKLIGENWVEKLSAATIFKSIEPLIRHSDIVQIDRDFLGWRRKYVEECLRKLFGKRFVGRYPLTDPKIQFIGKESDDVAEADRKSWNARHKRVDSHDCPDLTGLLAYL